MSNTAYPDYTQPTHFEGVRVARGGAVLSMYVHVWAYSLVPKLSELISVERTAWAPLFMHSPKIEGGGASENIVYVSVDLHEKE